MAPSTVFFFSPRQTPDELASFNNSRTNKNGRHYCPLCDKYGIERIIGRKPDLRRHLRTFHAHSAQWICKKGGYGLCFDFQSAYKEHIKENHSGIRDSKTLVELCQQVVFACGFAGCKFILEASSDDNSILARNQYFNHLLDHIFHPGANILSDGAFWSYSIRFRNLLRQDAVNPSWKEARTEGTEYFWKPQSSNVLRKMLESRHLVDIPALCNYAALIGKSRAVQINFPPGFALPELNFCSLQTPEHSPSRDIRWKPIASRIPEAVEVREAGRWLETMAPIRPFSSNETASYDSASWPLTPSAASVLARSITEAPLDIQRPNDSFDFLAPTSQIDPPVTGADLRPGASSRDASKSQTSTVVEPPVAESWPLKQKATDPTKRDRKKESQDERECQDGKE